MVCACLRTPSGGPPAGVGGRRHTRGMEPRPKLVPTISEPEFRRWYWLRDELAVFARTLGISASGSKPELANRIAAALAGRDIAVPERQPAGRQLAGPLTAQTVIPPGQRSSQLLRKFFRAHLGPSFRFDGAMRSFIATGGATLGDAVEHWHATRDTAPKPIASQFELNRFARQWHEDHPAGTRDELMRAWWAYRALPTDARAMA
jgi:hypothetical protein